MYAALVGEVDGVRLISPERLREATTVAISGTDEVFGMPTAFALGYAVGLPGSAAQDGPAVFGIGGAGGSYACGDAASGVAFALTKNRLTNDFTAATKVSQLVYSALSDR
jgi:hypothetical protein